MYKLIALDIDGTLINDDGVITPKTIQALKEAMNEGVMVTISTGRPVQGVRQHIATLGLSAPIITYNGAMIVDSDSSEIIFHKSLLEEDALQILALSKDIEGTVIVWCNNELYVSAVNDHSRTYEGIAKTPAILIEDEKALAQKGITKILWFDTVDNTNAHMEMLGGKLNDTINFCTSRAYFLEFFNGQVSKAEAMDFIGSKYDIKQEEMMAVGDQLNDLSMIEYAGLGVAMGNAHEGVKDIADVITLSNNEDGIARVVEDYILKKK